MPFQPTPSELFFTRGEAADPRLGERFQATPDLSGAGAVILTGNPDDEGIRLNGGRPGAAQAPDRIRKYLYRMTPPVRGSIPRDLRDHGNLVTAGALADRHTEARSLARDVISAGHRLVTLGGGHDYGFPDAAGFLDVTARESSRPLVINFDAHLDVRPTDRGLHSGTPFRRLLEEFPGRFHFVEVGLQNHCNSLLHADWASAQGAKLLFLDDVVGRSPASLLPLTPGRDLFLSLDLDVFAGADAPGVSAPAARGLSVELFFEWLRYLSQNCNLRGLGLYEVSPPLDNDDRTSRLAALVIHETLRLWGGP